MSTIVTIAAGDNISSSRSDINTNFSNLNTDKFESSNIDTDTTLAANSDTKVPSQKAIKTYVDTQGGANASETARGIVEEATDAEVTAGTATGATGAKLFVTPAKLLTYLSAGLPGKIEVDATEVTVANTVTETTLFDVSVAANTLSTNNAIRVTIYLSDFQCDSSESITFRLKYGATTIASLTMTTTGATSSNIDLNGAIITGLIVADGATNAQKGFLMFIGGDGVLEDDNLASVDGERGIGGGNGTATEDSTASKTLSVTAQWAATGASNTITAEAWIVEKIK